MTQLVEAFGEAYTILQEAATDRFPKVTSHAHRGHNVEASLTPMPRCHL